MRELTPLVHGCGRPGGRNPLARKAIRERVRRRPQIAIHSGPMTIHQPSWLMMPLTRKMMPNTTSKDAKTKSDFLGCSFGPTKYVLSRVLVVDTSRFYPRAGFPHAPWCRSFWGTLIGPTCPMTSAPSARHAWSQCQQDAAHTEPCGLASALPGA